MEFEDVSEAEIERKARRVAAAFGMQEFKSSGRSAQGGYEFILFLEGDLIIEVHWYENAIEMIQVGRQQSEFCEVWRDDDTNDWNVNGEPQGMCNLTARALYCLGVEDEEVFAELKCSLTAHDKMEFRLSLPREFWPKMWLDEEEEQTTNA